MKTKDLGTFQYIMVPAAGDVQWNEYTLNFAYGFSLAQGHDIGMEASYRNTDYRYFDTQFSLNTESLEEMHLLMAGVFYRGDISGTWEIEAAFSPVISSNLGNALQNEDIQYAGNIKISKFWNKNEGTLGLAMGLGYGALRGKPDLYPLVHLLGHHGNWHYQIGYPETMLHYQINPRHQLRAQARVQGSYFNVSDELFFRTQGSLTNSKLEFDALNFGICHTYKLQPNITSLIQLGYLAENKLQLLGPQEQELTEFNTQGSPYISMGLTLNLMN